MELLTDTDMLLMVENGIRGRMCQFINGYANSNTECMKDYNKNKESSCLIYWDVNNSYGCCKSC